MLKKQWGYTYPYLKIPEKNQPVRCGWLKGKFGLQGRIVPANLSHLLQPTDAGLAQRFITTLMQIDNIDMNQLQPAAAAEHPAPP
ncbi:hypothetical protein AAE02nite_46960 [Adhaeribacter aerolatus]|uniref:Uncharacterized protein n=1 Tax=Adhaeribacter aerolatus TaxID=670289 RepID=A0A512B4Z2_9BACT|nr:hypothetical protein [Adhaeribacter aerolatus]GEO07032.1 hypothetical protein AAE02nite_46960 [Adhaeribacter aerolatus]